MRHSFMEEVEFSLSGELGASDPDIQDLITELHVLTERLSSALASDEPGSADQALIDRALAEILRVRKRRNKLFGSDMFGEPAWDIILELYAAERAGQKLSVTGACYSSGVPITTALRWILRLEQQGWVHRIGDSSDKRRSWLVLNRAIHHKICQLLTIRSAPDRDQRGPCPSASGRYS